MLTEYILPAGFHCLECGNGTAFAVIIDASHADAPIVCNECGFEYGRYVSKTGWWRAAEHPVASWVSGTRLGDSMNRPQNGRLERPTE